MGNRRISKLIPGIAVFAVPLLCQSGSAYADNISGGAIPVGASLSGASVTVSTDGAVNIEVVPTADGSLGVNKNQVTVDTTAGSGYTLYISSANTDASGYAPLYLNGMWQPRVMTLLAIYLLLVAFRIDLFVQKAGDYQLVKAKALNSEPFTILAIAVT